MAITDAQHAQLTSSLDEGLARMVDLWLALSDLERTGAMFLVMSGDCPPALAPLFRGFTQIGLGVVMKTAEERERETLSEHAT